MTWESIGYALAFILGAIGGGIGVGSLIFYAKRNWVDDPDELNKVKVGGFRRPKWD